MSSAITNPELIRAIQPEQGMLDFIAELQVRMFGEATTMCWHEGAEHHFTLRLSIEENGNRSIVGGARVRNKWVCTEHQLAAIFGHTPPNPSWRPLSPAVVAVMEAEELNDRLVSEGYFDEVPVEQPDTWPVLTGAQLLAEYGTGDDQ